jgi:hypothetical protein
VSSLIAAAQLTCNLSRFSFIACCHCIKNWRLLRGRSYIDSVVLTPSWKYRTGRYHGMMIEYVGQSGPSPALVQPRLASASCLRLALCLSRFCSAITESSISFNDRLVRVAIIAKNGFAAPAPHTCVRQGHSQAEWGVISPLWETKSDLVDRGRECRPRGEYIVTL